MILWIAHVCVAWSVMHAEPEKIDDPEPPRIMGPPPSLIRSRAHLGIRWHSDDPLDQAITVQFTAWAITL